MLTFGNYTYTNKEELEQAKAELLEDLIGTIRELAKQDGFWITKDLMEVAPGSVIFSGDKVYDMTVAWKLGFPNKLSLPGEG